MMADPNYYLATVLPALGELGSAPPMTPYDLVQHARGLPIQARVEAVVLSDDLHQRDAFLAGELLRPEPGVLTLAQTRGEALLPDFLAPDVPEDAGRRTYVDGTWTAYFRYASALARGHGLLAHWLASEIWLRNTLATERAKALGLEAEPRLVTPELGAPARELEGAISEWSAATTPLAGLHVLLRARWQWLARREAWFTFDDDEMIAYAAKLILLHRWYRLARGTAPDTDEGAPA
ncbi:MAG: hypothetical protein P8Z36_02235 [Gemmatimonadota bacterium]|jgi:hypothetical protein